MTRRLDVGTTRGTPLPIDPVRRKRHALAAIPVRFRALGEDDDGESPPAMPLDRVCALILLAAGLTFTPPAWRSSGGSSRNSSTQIQYSFAPIVKRIAPAVVNVYASRVVEQSQSPFISDPFFRRFFGDGPDIEPPTQRVQSSLGSGIIVDASGIIITNHHVIANFDEIKVALGGPARVRLRGRAERPAHRPCRPPRQVPRRRAAPMPNSATPTSSRSATWCSPSATPSVSARP